MNLLLLIYLLIMVPLLLFLFMGMTIGYPMVHKSMTIEDSETWGYGTFKDFLKEFNATQWDRKKLWKYSFFGVGSLYHKDYIHADIIKFKGKGMVMRTWLDFVRFKIFLFNNRYKGTTKSSDW